MLLARADQLQTQQVQGLGAAIRTAGGVVRPRAARLRPRHLQRLGPAAQGGMVGNGESETQQANDRADQAFGLAQR